MYVPRFISAAAVLLSVCLMAEPSCTRPENQPALPGNPAPPFSLRSLDGSTIRLEDHEGSVVIVDFWATWCGPCKRASRELESLHRKYRERGVVIIGISVDRGSDAAGKVREFAEAQGITYLLLLDDGTAKKAYGVTRIPSTFVIDRDHVIRDLYPGFRPGLGGDISRALDKLLSSLP